jgi:hypothetical protein
MIECPSCHRHVRVDETACPFCRAAGSFRGLDRTLGAAVTTFVLAACYGTVDGTKGLTGDTAGDADVLRVTSYDVTCDPAGTSVSYRAFTTLTPHDGVLFQQETASTYETGGNLVQYSDEHDLVNNAAGDGLERTLSTGVADPERNVSTLFSCATGQQLALGNDFVSYAFGVYDESGALADCLAGGHAPQALVDGTYAQAAVNAPGFDLSTCRAVVPAR